MSHFTILPAVTIARVPESVPAVAGIYALLIRDGVEWFDELGLFRHEPDRRSLAKISGEVIGYVGSVGSRGLRARLADHVLGTGYASTFRRTVGCLMQRQLGLSTYGAQGASYFHFGAEGEPRLNAWLAERLVIAFRPSLRPVSEERSLMRRHRPPLNLKEQQRRPFAVLIQGLRADAAAGGSPRMFTGRVDRSHFPRGSRGQRNAAYNIEQINQAGL